MTDEEAIVFAGMAGCEFYTNQVGSYFASAHDEPFEAFENVRRDETDGSAAFGSAATLAHAFCRFYKLGDYADDQRHPAG